MSVFSQLKNKLHSSQFSKNVLKLGGGTVLGQALVVGSTPILTRLYNPSEMGLVGICMAFIGFLAVGLGLRYDMAIVTAKNPREADRLLVASLVFSFPTAVLAGCLMLIMIEYNMLSYGVLPKWSALAVVLILLFTGLFTSLRYWHVKRGDFSSISKALISQGAGRSLLPILLGFVQVGWVGLLFGELAGRGMGIWRLLQLSWPNIKRTLRYDDISLYKTTLVRDWKFPGVVLPSSLLDSLVGMLPLPIIAHLFGPAAAGQFFLVQRVISLPSGLVGASIGDVFHAKLSGAYLNNRHQIRGDILNLIKKLTSLSLIIYMPIAIIAPFVFSVVFGNEWGSAGILMSVLSIISVVGMIVNPTSRILFVVNRPELKLIVDVFRLVFPSASLFIMYWNGFNFLMTMVVFSVTSTIAYLLYLFLILHVSKTFSR